MPEKQKPVEAEWFRAIVDATTELAIISMDPEGRILTWNSGAERMFRSTAAQVVGENARVIFTPEDLVTGFADRELGVAAVEGHARDDRWHLRRDGSRVWAMGMLMAVRGEDGLIRGFVKIVQDRTEERRIEEDLKDSEERFARAFLGNPAGITVERRNDGSFVLANERFFQLTGYWRSEVMGRSGESLGVWAKSERKGILDRLAAGERLVTGEVTISSKAGETRRCAATFTYTELGGNQCILGTYVPLDTED